MSLESKIDALNVNLENLTNAVVALVYAMQANNAAPAIAPAPTTPQAVEPEPAPSVDLVEAAKQDRHVTPDDLKELCLAKSRENGSLRAPIKAVLAEYGATKVADIDPSKIGECFDKVAAL